MRWGSSRAGGRNATEVRLDRCYRCTPEIVAVANSVIRGAPAGSGAPGAAVWLRSQRAAGVAPEIVACADDVRGGCDRRRPHHRPRGQRVGPPRHRDPHAHERCVGTDRGRVRRGQHPVHHARGRAVLRPARGPRGDRADARSRRRGRRAPEEGLRRRPAPSASAGGAASGAAPARSAAAPSPDPGRARGVGVRTRHPARRDWGRGQRPGGADPRRPGRDGLALDRPGQRGSDPGAVGVPGRGPGPGRGGRRLGAHHDVGAGRGVRASRAAVPRARPPTA